MFIWVVDLIKKFKKIASKFFETRLFYFYSLFQSFGRWTELKTSKLDIHLPASNVFQPFFWIYHLGGGPNFTFARDRMTHFHIEFEFHFFPFSSNYLGSGPNYKHPFSPNLNSIRVFFSE